MSTLDGSLLREVARVQHDKTIQAVRDAIDSIPVDKHNERSYGREALTAARFRDDLLFKLRQMREAAQ